MSAHQIRDQYLKFPGISRAALAMAPTNLDVLKVGERMLAILLAGASSHKQLGRSTPSCSTSAPTHWNSP